MNWKLGLAVLVAFGAVGMADGVADAKPLYEVKCPTGYTLNADVLNPRWFQCDKAGTTVTAAYTCPSGYVAEVRSGLNKDRCVKTTTVTTTPQCRLQIGDVRDNWTRQTKVGNDVCTSDKGKDSTRGVECTGGTDYHSNSGADTCTKSSEAYADPSCASGYTMNPNDSRDICEKKSATSTVKPIF